MTTPRLYAGLNDLRKVQELLRDGIRAHPYSYNHPGDVEWWIYYNPRGDTAENSLYLWEDGAGNTLGWLFCLTRYAEFDLFVHPSARGSSLEAEMVALAEETLRPYLTLENPQIEMGSIFADHVSLQALLTQRGYTLRDEVVLFQQSLTTDLPVPILPDGFYFLPAMEARYADLRAEVHLGAFTPSGMTADLYRQFMLNAPNYHPEADIVIVAPDGHFAAFGMTWYDDVLKLGEFEPVGTHRDYQRQGFGRAVMQEGMRRMQARGLTRATVCTGLHQGNNVQFYEACGFQRMNMILRGAKTLDGTSQTAPTRSQAGL